MHFENSKRYCYLCGSALTKENKSNEHIIPNALGGKLKSKDLICKTCNSTFGYLYDAEICKQLHPFASMLNITRDKGENRDLKKIKSQSGVFYDLVEGRKPTISNPQVNISKNGAQTEIQVVAPNRRRMMKILKDLKKEYPGLNLDDIEDKFTTTFEYLKEPLELKITIGSKETLKAVAKIAANAYLHFGGDPNEVIHIANYITSDMDNKYVFHFHPSDDIYDINSNKVFHILYVKGDCEVNKLYVYIELMSLFSFLVILNDNYCGESFSKNYIYEVRSGKEELNPFNLDIPEDWWNIAKPSYRDVINAKFVRMQRIIDDYHFDIENNRIIHEVSEKVFSAFPEGAPITEELLELFVKELAKNMAPLIAHTNSRYKRIKY